MPVTIGGSGPITGVTSINTTVSDTELGYLDGVTSAIQSQINTAGGLVKITDQSFSAASAVNVNNCFTSTYSNYRIVVDQIVASGAPGLFMRLRASGSDNSTSNYNTQRVQFSSASISPGRDASGTWGQVGDANTSLGALIIDVFAPQLAVNTVFQASSTESSSTGILFRIAHTGFNATTQFDGFSLIPNSGTFSGTLRVYGYRN